jgi:hypothetical protein
MASVRESSYVPSKRRLQDSVAEDVLSLSLPAIEPEPRGRYVRTPMLDEGKVPGAVAGAGVARVPGVYRSGDMIVIAPEAWEPKVESFHPLMVFAVRAPAGWC